MNTFSNAFRAEVIRMARKELKPELQGMRKTLTAHRSEIAALKREVKALTSQLRTAQRQVHPPLATSVTENNTPSRKRGRKWVFDAEKLKAKRAALGLSQKDMAKLLHTSSISLYKWESGKVIPRSAHLQQIHEVLQIGKRQLLATLSENS